MRRISLAATLLLGAACATLGPAACSRAEKTAPASAPAAGIGIDTSAIDPAIKPGDDFNLYANGKWLARTQIPQDRSSIGAFDIATKTTEREQGDLIAAILKGSPAPGTPEARIADYYRAYMNRQAIDAAGLQPVRADLDRYARIADKTDLARVLGDQTEVDVDLFNSVDYQTENLFGLFVTKSLTTADVVPYIFQGGLAMPNRDYYLSTDPVMAGHRKAYRAYVENFLASAGFDDAAARADRIVALETKIAKAQASAEEVDDFAHRTTLWSPTEFSRKAPGLDWTDYLGAARIGSAQKIAVYNPEAVTGISALVASEPLDAWKDWLAFHRLNAQTDVLPSKLDQMHFAFFGTELSGTPAQRPREKLALDAVNADLGASFGKLYVAKYFPPSAKKEVEGMTVQLKEAFARRIKALDWMAPETKKEALAKIDATVIGVGYPDHWADDTQFPIAANSAYANRMAAIRSHTLEQLAKIGKPIDRSEWWMNPQLVNAVNLPVQNALNFPAAILQKPFFDPAADAAFNYGAIGAVIGHELSHSFDSNGAMVDATGTIRNWWTPADLAHFKAQSEALAKQYDAYEPFPGVHLNGRQELGENGADVAGLLAAYEAYRHSLGGKELPVIDGLTGDQRFFIAYAQSWMTKMRDGALRQRVVSDGHAPGMYRALTVRNLDAWYKAFDVQPGGKLYLAPDKRVRLW